MFHKLLIVFTNTVVHISLVHAEEDEMVLSRRARSGSGSDSGGY